MLFKIPIKHKKLYIIIYIYAKYFCIVPRVWKRVDVYSAERQTATTSRRKNYLCGVEDYLCGMGDEITCRDADDVKAQLPWRNKCSVCSRG